MSTSIRVTLEEAAIWSDMVATFYSLTGRDPDDGEARSMVEAARVLTAERRSPHPKGGCFKIQDALSRDRRPNTTRNFALFRKAGHP